MQTTERAGRRPYEKPSLRKSLILLQSVTAQLGSPAPDDEEEDNGEVDILIPLPG